MHVHASDLPCLPLPQCRDVFGRELSARQRKERSTGLELSRVAGELVF